MISRKPIYGGALGLLINVAKFINFVSILLCIYRGKWVIFVAQWYIVS